MKMFPFNLKIAVLFAVALLHSGQMFSQTGPYVEIKGSINGRTVNLAAIGSSPDQLHLTYNWTQDDTNPEKVSFSSETEETVSFVIPDIDGEYFVNVTVTDTNGKTYRARRLITSDGDGVFINTSDHYPRWVNEMNLYEINPYSWNHGAGIFTNVKNDFDRIRDLGINTIWFTPIFESLGEGMGYWTYDYYSLYSGFGSKEDFKSFVEAAHEKGIRVILDIVFNHTGDHHPFFQSCLQQKAQSPYADYYIWDGIPGDSDYDFFYDWTRLPNLNVINPDVEEYLIGVAEYWVENFNIDGFRADVAWGIELRSDVFWKNFTKRLRNIKPEIFLLGEGHAKPVPGSMEENPSTEHNKSILFDDRFNSAYDWELRNWNPDAGLPGLLEGKIRINDLNTILDEEYPERALPLRFIENHDHPRATALFDIDRSKLAHTLVFTVPGIPLLYWGAETGQTEQFWAPGPDTYGVQPYFQRLVQARRAYIDNDATMRVLPNTSSDDIYSYATISGENRVVVTALNFRGSEKQFSLDLSSLAGNDMQKVLLRDPLNEKNYVVNSAYLSDLPVSLGGYEARVYVFDPVDNLVFNGSFKSGIYPWYMYINEAADASAGIFEYAVEIDISQPGTTGWHIQLIQSNLPIEEGEIYELSFMASSDQNRTINIIVSEDGGDYSAYFNETINLDTELSEHMFSFEMNEATDLDSRLVFEMGDGEGNVLIDDVKLRRKGALSGKPGMPDIKPGLEIFQNYPNPVTYGTKISFYLGHPVKIDLNLYNLNGEKIETLMSEKLSAGLHDVYFEVNDLPPGVYIYELSSRFGKQRRKMLITSN